MGTSGSTRSTKLAAVCAVRLAAHDGHTPRVLQESLLGRARAAMADELTANKALPPNLVDQTFGYFDELSLTRTTNTKPVKPKGDKPVEG
jgi:hypothetical protein